MTNFGAQLEQYANGNLPACNHPIKAVDDNNFCHKCGKQLEVSTNSGTNYVEALLIQVAEQAATIARLAADAKLNDMAWTDNQAALNKQAEENRALKGLLENSRIALTFYREWMFSHAETRYPFGHEIESEIALKLAGES